MKKKHWARVAGSFFNRCLELEATISALREERGNWVKENEGLRDRLETLIRENAGYKEKLGICGTERNNAREALVQEKARADAAEAETERLSAQLREQVPASRVLCDGSVICDVCGETITGTPHMFKDCLETLTAEYPSPKARGLIDRIHELKAELENTRSELEQMKAAAVELRNGMLEEIDGKDKEIAALETDTAVSLLRNELEQTKAELTEANERAETYKQSPDGRYRDRLQNIIGLYFGEIPDASAGALLDILYQKLKNALVMWNESVSDLHNAKSELAAAQKLVNELVTEKAEIRLALGIPEGTIVHEGVPAVAQRQREELEAAKERLKFYEGTASKLSWAEQVLASGEARDRLSGLLGLTTSDVTGDARQVASWAAIEERVELQEKSLQKVSGRLEAWRSASRRQTRVPHKGKCEWWAKVPDSEIPAEEAT